MFYVVAMTTTLMVELNTVLTSRVEIASIEEGRPRSMF